MRNNVYTIDEIKRNNPILNIGDTVVSEGYHFVVINKTIESTAEKPCYIKYNLVPLDIYMNDVVINNFTSHSPKVYIEMPYCQDKQTTNEISEEARQEFLKLLE